MATAVWARTTRIVNLPVQRTRLPQATRLTRPAMGTQHVRPQQRSITNATVPDYTADLLNVQRVEAKEGGWHPTLLHSSGDTKFTVIRLEPVGGQVPKHRHSVVWDYFVPLQGRAVIEVETPAGERQDHDMQPGSFLAVPPEHPHCVRNVSDTEEFVFLISQSPRKQYDFVAVK